MGILGLTSFSRLFVPLLFSKVLTCFLVIFPPWIFDQQIEGKTALVTG